MMNEVRLNNILFVVIIGLLILVLYKLYNKQENLTLSEEAVQNIASVYADASGTVTFNNVKITGTLDCSGIIHSDSTINGHSLTADSGVYVGSPNATISLYGDGGNIGINGYVSASKINVGQIGVGSINGANWYINSSGAISVPGGVTTGNISANGVTIQGQPAMREQTSYRENYYGGHNDTHVYYAYPTT
jgi:cytoskeletal protein CcmA (bactofilin family)